MIQKLTIDQVRSNASSFLYIFADEEQFLSRINQKYANIIRGKKANQNKLLDISAREYGSTYDEYAAAVREGFVAAYGIEPKNALVILAQGGTVAGKNWSEGVYGVGSLSNKFKGTNITVNSKTGVMSNNGVEMPTTNTIYDEFKGQTIAYQIFAKEGEKTYMSQYNKTLKKYYAQSYSTADGKKYSASGKEINDSESGTIWESIILNLQNFLEWLVSLFTDKGKTTTITSENTLPDQKTDGFVSESGFGEMGSVALLLLAGGTLLATGSLGGRKNKSK